MSEVSTCLWFGKDAESAVRFYVSIVPGSTIDRIQRSPGAWPGGEAGDVILISFRLGGQSFQALNGGAPVEYGTAVSISVQCADQAEIDRLWAALTADGGAEIMCGWLRDRWGVPWQIVPEVLPRLLAELRSGRFCARLRRNAGHGEAGRCRAGTRGGSVTRLLWEVRDHRLKYRKGRKIDAAGRKRTVRSRVKIARNGRSLEPLQVATGGSRCPRQ